MNEDDTFNRLKRCSFEHLDQLMNDILPQFGVSLDDTGYDIICRSHGWDIQQWRDELHRRRRNGTYTEPR